MKEFLFILFFFLSLPSLAQQNRYVVQFKDKSGTPFSITDPSKFLSKRSVERRINQHIPVNETDLPLVPWYIDSVRNAGNVQIINQSKWLNQVLIETNDPSTLNKISLLPFVLKTQPVNRLSGQHLVTRKKFIEENKGSRDIREVKGAGNKFDYGNAFGQIHLHEGEYLHDQGFLGEGMLVAMIDAGFYHYKSLPVFDSLNANNQVMDTYDFVKNQESVNEESEHGMFCLSVMASNLPGQFIGTSPKALFLLYRSEDAGQESPMEEQNWIAAMERADSAGADITTTSLGYYDFDNPQFNYSYKDLNGKTSMIAKAATLAARKGIILLASAGNEGLKDWKYITTPADADSILSVGAVDASGIPGNFSSYGPTADGRVAPTVASVGVSTYISSPGGPLTQGNGTSFSAPNLAGLVACLWQAFPEFTNMEIIGVIKQSSSSFQNPDNRIGYGIPNFRLAFENLEKQRNERQTVALPEGKVMKVYPNPFKETFTIILKPKNTALATFLLYNSNGKLITTQQIAVTADKIIKVKFDHLPPLQKGYYILQLLDGNMSESMPVLLQ